MKKPRDRLYQEIAGRLIADIAAGGYQPGDRLPTERELAASYDVSRPTIREAIIALEVQGFVEVRMGSGAYLLRLPGKDEEPDFGVSAFELSEARWLVESECAALAAVNITDEELANLARLVEKISAENEEAGGREEADREFHLAIARATRNAAMEKVVAQLWDLRANSPESALLHAKARMADVKPVVQEHADILEGLKTRDPARARQAMQDHLTAVIDSLLFATEEQAIADARKAYGSRRARFDRLAS
ncbi:FadR family transcriptional regulator [Aurantiacibacter xanthus]|uniref:FadR family transcriptional regulator n=1 Tax=Aurantiacibacter xanthus TaxID=1784712 RepID=A0A3A1P6S1_9SPHN|nr:FadR/GntR family transcriptional regulator [Aurantiacibacter xanthus]RIV84121.1 FadR family transcriptional regulator [Aurantiacibacter xanthus]